MTQITFDSTGSNNHLTIGNFPFSASTGRPGTGIIRYTNDDNGHLIAFHIDATQSSATAYYMNGGAAVPSNEVSQKRFDITWIYEASS